MCGCYLCAAHHSWATAQAVTLEAERDYAAGEAVSMDYGVGKLDSQVLLDHGVLDVDNPQARLLRPRALCSLSLTHRGVLACAVLHGLNQ